MKLTEEQIARVKALEDEHGTLTPDAIVADAKRKDSPLHDLIDWDRNKAAKSWWLECAREIIREVKLVITTQEVTMKAPYYVRDPDAKGQGYKSVVLLQRDPASARQALIDELQRASGVVARARELAVAFGLQGEMDDLLVRIVGLHGRVELAKAS